MSGGFIRGLGKAVNVVFLGVPGALINALTPTPPTQKIALGEISQQTAKEAEPRAIVWGRYRPIGGNIIHCQAPVKRWITTTQKVGGKGGKKKKQKTKTEHVYRTYAIGVCEGPITKYVRIWRNGKLVYDARGNAWGTQNNAVFTNMARLYLGGWSQTVDPTLESIWGAGTVPAYRGTAYIVVIDDDLTDMGGAVPQYQFEVERAEGIFYTSRPYDVEVIEAMEHSIDDVRPNPGFDAAAEAIDSGVTLLSGELRDLQQEYSETEAIDSAMTLQSGSLAVTLIPYTYTTEAIDSSVTIQSGSLEVTLVEYSDYPPEAIDSTVTLTSGSLT